MQIVSNGKKLHGMSNPVFFGKVRKNIINLSSADLAQGAVKVKGWIFYFCKSFRLQADLPSPGRGLIGILLIMYIAQLHTEKYLQ